MNRYVVAITGASGLIYARELLAYFAGRPDLELHAVISSAGEQVLQLELGLTPAQLAPGARAAGVVPNSRPNTCSPAPEITACNSRSGRPAK